LNEFVKIKIVLIKLEPHPPIPSFYFSSRAGASVHWMQWLLLLPPLRSRFPTRFLLFLFQKIFI
jgi:hypothetical protein